jgi:hypothetical protein
MGTMTPGCFLGHYEMKLHKVRAASMFSFSNALIFFPLDFTEESI